MWKMSTAVSLALSLGACTPVVGIPQAESPSSIGLTTPSSGSAVRQTDANGHPLPFTNVFPRRWSNGNDGTAYEPCTAASSEILSANDLDPASVRDAAIADHQTARGCRWSVLGQSSAYISQIVGNQPALEAYKLQQDEMVHWLPNTSIGGRTAAVGSSPLATDCTTFVESGEAIVATRASVNISPPPISEICDKAIAFTRATIDQIPE